MRVFLGRGLWIVFALSTVVVTPVRGQAAETPPDSIAALIKQLADPKFTNRQAASKELIAQGDKALPALRKVVNSTDPEVRRRAHDAIHAILLTLRKSKGSGLEMVVIDEGSFQMGSPRNESNRRADETQHRVKITQPFLLGAYEVTQEEYEKVTRTNPSWFAPTGDGKERVARLATARFPVERVTWYDAIEFCNKLSKLDGFEAYYKVANVKKEGDAIKSATVTIAGGRGYRLPTEAEWEYACRAETTKPYFFGFENSGREANLRPGPAIGYGGAPSWPTLERTAKVGSYAPNSWGLYDMHGNAAEWCWDWYDKDYYANSPEEDPPGPDKGNQRVLRSGSWMVQEGSCRAASRFWLTPDEAKYYAGFRVARTP